MFFTLFGFWVIYLTLLQKSNATIPLLGGDKGVDFYVHILARATRDENLWGFIDKHPKKASSRRGQVKQNLEGLNRKCSVIHQKCISRPTKRMRQCTKWMRRYTKCMSISRLLRQGLKRSSFLPFITFSGLSKCFRQEKRECKARIDALNPNNIHFLVL